MIGPAVGGSLGGLALIGLVVLGVFLWKVRVRLRFNSPARDEAYEAGHAAVPPTYLGYSPAQDQQGNQEPSPTTQPQSTTTVNNWQATRCLFRRTYQVHIPSRDPETTSTAPTHRREHPRVASISHSQVEGLRAQVADLQQTVLELQAERMEPPPNYGDIRAERLNTLRPSLWRGRNRRKA